MGITMSELAKLAGVSRQAVSAALNNGGASRVSPAKRARILELARETGYVPNIAARQLKGIADRLVGLITVPSHMGIAATLQSEVISALQRRGFEALTTQHYDTETVLRGFKARRVSGVIMLRDFPVMKQLGFCPFVTCDSQRERGFDVKCDHEAGAFEATAHLLNVHRRRKIVFVAIDDSLSGSNGLKYAGMLRAAREGGIKVDASNLLLAKTTLRRSDSGLYETIAADAGKMVAEIIKRGADAILCTNDFIAGRLIHWLKEAGLNIPSDIAVVGFDGYTWTRFTDPPLATIVQPVRKMAEVTVETLAERIEKNIIGATSAEVKIKPSFLPAESCGCATKRSKLIDGLAETIIPET